MTARSEYESRLQARQQTLDQLRRQDDQASSFRAALFCVGVLVAWIVWGGWGVPWPWLLVPAALFTAAVVYHESIQRRQRLARRGIEYYQRCLARLDGKWSGPDGSEFADPTHPYSGDLDLFGPGSLLQLLNAPVTPSGWRTLARWLTPDPVLPSRDTVLERQAAVQTLGPQIDLREQLALIGPAPQSATDATELERWLTSPSGLTAPWVRVLGILLGLLGTAALGTFFAGAPPSLLVLVVAVQLGFLYRLGKPLAAIKKHSEHAVFELRRIAQVVAVLETTAGDSPLVARLRGELLQEGEPTSVAIGRLERTVSQFENLRRNVFLAPLALISMLGLHFAAAIDRWRVTHGPHVDRWFEAIGVLEALLAFSQFHFENPTYCFPTLTDGPPQWSGQAVAHPLLPAAVANDVRLDDRCQLLLVSGSNMSGKSTLLRSVGINTALAWAGAPVCASALTLARLEVAAAMRIQDSLQTGTSHFFAELKRIQLIVQRAQGETSVLFLLDEILHGTNSHDRLVGARGVIETLLNSGAIGLVTTHDLALSDIVAELAAPSKNVHFRDAWVDGKMTFDYQMRDGVVPKSNALSLMRLLGLDV